ncbi:hypothetical protein B0H14DRAFT_2917527 [Mycena olivaceomarginata]|nr:hypothetical protein B0H14DRAFT_2917527 [Mycena olivaceomarginata]
MQHLQFRCYRALAVTLRAIRRFLSPLLWILTIFASYAIWITKTNIETSITADTSISGFYGPGAWCTWLITLGLSHGHTFMTLLRSGEPPSVDYDLIAASFYTAAATIDLIAKSVTIARLGVKASESVLLPALLCAERVVSLGTGSYLWTIIIFLCFGRHPGLCTACIVIISFVSVLVASVFTFHAHQVIFRTAPVPWCDLHTQTGPLSEEHVSHNLVDFPSWVVRSFVEICSEPVFWGVLAIYTGGGDPGLISALKQVAVPLVCLPTSPLVFPVVFEAPWLVMWVMSWWPMYFLAFFPQIGYYPPSGISVLEMDQIAALLSVVIVAAIHFLRPIFKYACSSAASEEEGAPLIPLSTRAIAPGSSEERLS